ncbi:homoserine O-acetyltransferase [Streptomyces sp. NPDC005908]|uniref:homoserine O-acetyltransferase MetX n=1 Tax=Streptomyces sp. NPDC005908 TaxID=3157084 RepID=UPI0034073133
MTPSPVPLPPASGAWREGDPPERRQWYAHPEPLPLEAGGELPDVRLAFETWGRLAPDRSNAVLVLHALTGDSHVAGPAEPGHPTPGWWDGLVGPGWALDTDRWFVVAPNVLGGCQGSTGPSFRGPSGRRWGCDFPFLTQRDQVAAEAALADALGIDRWALAVGGSMGGMRAVEWAVSYPERTGALLLVATTAAASAEQIAWAGTQTHAIRADPHWHGGHYHDTGRGPHAGLGLARRIAHITYRSEPELRSRFGRAAQDGEDPWRGGRYQVASYLDHSAYDTGLAVSQLVLKAHALGLHGHQMSGFDAEVLHGSLGVPVGYRALSVGAPAPADLLPPRLRERETAARERRPVAETFFGPTWGTPLPTGP